MYLWVDITGCKFIDGDTKKVQWHAAYNEITAWAVEHDEFKVKLLGRKGKLKERTFMTGYDKATQKLAVATTANQDPCSTVGLVPLLGVDVWEHAYYLQYKNVRPDYVNAIWDIVNWKDVAGNLAAAK